MAKKTSIKELRNMNLADLTKEVLAQKSLVAKMRLGIEMAKEKDTGRYQRERKQLARMSTVETEKKKEVQQKDSSPSTTAA